MCFTFQLSTQLSTKYTETAKFRLADWAVSWWYPWVKAFSFRWAPTISWCSCRGWLRIDGPAEDRLVCIGRVRWCRAARLRLLVSWLWRRPLPGPLDNAGQTKIGLCSWIQVDLANKCFAISETFHHCGDWYLAPRRKVRNELDLWRLVKSTLRRRSLHPSCFSEENASSSHAAGHAGLYSQRIYAQIPKRALRIDPYITYWWDTPLAYMQHT